MEEQFRQIASLIGDPTRATIMWVLMDGKAFTATELAIASDTSPQNISMHLAKLVQADLLAVESQGRHRYYKFSRKEIAYAIEAMANLAPHRKEGKNAVAEESLPVRYCRTCYDHLAGKIGVAITDGLLKRRIIIADDDKFDLGKKGISFFTDLGIDINEVKKQRRLFAKPCLDWSERRHHIAGSLGAAMLDKMLSEDWIRRTKNSRAVVITAKGRKELCRYFGISL
jgi:DNA-binding transcriptional ArsR family regulator